MACGMDGAMFLSEMTTIGAKYLMTHNHHKRVETQAKHMLFASGADDPTWDPTTAAQELQALPRSALEIHSSGCPKRLQCSDATHFVQGMPVVIDRSAQARRCQINAKPNEKHIGNMALHEQAQGPCPLMCHGINAAASQMRREDSTMPWDGKS